ECIDRQLVVLVANAADKSRAVGETELGHEVSGAESVARVVRPALGQRRDDEDAVARPAEASVKNLLRIERHDRVGRARRADRIRTSVGVSVRVPAKSTDLDVVFAAKRLEGELVVELSLIARFMKRREGADRALVSGIQPAQRLASTRGMRDGLD